MSTSAAIPMGAIADALIATVTPNLVGQGVIPDTTRCIFYPGIKTFGTTYPALARTRLPRVVFVFENDSSRATVGSGGVVAECEILGAFYLQEMHALRADHQRILETHLQAIKTPFLGNYTPVAIAGVPGFTGYGTDSAGVSGLISTPLKDLDHELKSPNMRIYQGKLQLKFSIRIRLF